MSATSTPSVSSDQTRYYDALVMQFSAHTDDTGGAGPGSSSAGPRPGGENAGLPEHMMEGLSRSFAVPPHFTASGNPSDTNQPSHTEGMGYPSKHVDDEAQAGQRSPSLRSLPTEPDGEEKYVSGMRRTFGGTGSGLARKESVRTTRSTRTTGTASAFANGAPLTGPNAEPNVDDSLFVRGAKAERSLSQKQKDRIMKVESEFSNRDHHMALTQNGRKGVQDVFEASQDGINQRKGGSRLGSEEPLRPSRPS